MHWLSSTILFTIHQSYLFLWYPISSRILESFFQKSSYGYRVTYIAFLASAYMHYFCGYLYIWSICSSMVLFTWVESPLPPPSWSICLPYHTQFVKKAPGMSAVATSWPSIVSIMHDNTRPSVDTFGDDVSYLDSQLLWFLSSEHPILLTGTS